MNIQKISEQQGMVQNFGFGSGSEYGYSMFPQCFQESPAARDEDRTQQQQQQQNFWSDNSSTTMISHIGPPSTAFFATERCMGLTQYDSIDKDPSSSSTCSNLSNLNYDMRMNIQEQQTPGNAFFLDSSSPPPPLPVVVVHDDDDARFFRAKNRLQAVKEATTIHSPSSSNRSTYTYRNNPFSNLSEKERILHLKNKLLGEYDNAIMRRHPSSSLPFNGNQDGGVSHT